ncbi:hypothetical protein FJQ54_01030 [Sandaracinobacter neustonicus]|uniref:Uncharacterized protein n=1 Tax=Sandaracinobacter neustonicus TaxID=1715348 RepID=A0A501XWY7_9SPHN|nr:hypothetical protein [Sandaracinobacter neustonicus]TPE64614.1 hypothetical protein FJQ54_01030 [Sandaracinobacter neustonicus]
MRSWVAIAGLLLAGAAIGQPALGQAATIQTEKPEGPTGWVESGEQVRLGRAGIALPKEIRGFRLIETRLLDAQGFDAVARYQRGDEHLTLYLYQPIDNAARLQWNSALNIVRRRLQSEGGGAAQQVEAVAAARGPAMLASFDNKHAADVLMMGRLDNGWNLKLRLSSRPPAAEARAEALALFNSIALPEGRSLIAPDLRPIPACEPLEFARTPKAEQVSSQQRMQLTLGAVAMLSSVGKETDTTDWCTAGATQIGQLPITLYRGPAEKGANVYRVPLGDNGAMLKLEPAVIPVGKAGWWLLFDRISDRIVLQILDGPGDDADMADIIARFDQLAREPVTIVGRN